MRNIIHMCTCIHLKSKYVKLVALSTEWCHLKTPLNYGALLKQETCVPRMFILPPKRPLRKYYSKLLPQAELLRVLLWGLKNKRYQKTPKNYMNNGHNNVIPFCRFRTFKKSICLTEKWSSFTKWFLYKYLFIIDINIY